MRPDRAARPAVAAFALALSLAAAAVAAPDITGPEARAFLGGRTGKIVYLKNQLRQMYFIDLSDSILVERRIAEDAYCISPQIHPDGSRVLYETEASVFIRTLEEGSAQRVLVAKSTPMSGVSLEPHWWIHPKTGDEYVIFSTGNVNEAEWPPKSGMTYIQKVEKGTGRPVGSALTMLPFAMSGGRSKDGTWGATSHHTTGMYKFQPEKVENAFFASTNWMDAGALMACNASISPSKDPARQNRMMHLNSGVVVGGGRTIENHKAILIRSWNDAGTDSPFWYMGIPGDRSNDDGSGNLFWEHPEWSNDEDYFTAVGSKIVEGYAEADLYVGRISYAGDSQIRRVLKGGGINHYPHLWIKDGLRPARIRLEKTALAFVSLKGDSAGPAPDFVVVKNDGDGTLPPLAVGKLPAWLDVAVLGNGTNSPRLVVSVDRDSAGIGDHQATVKVAYGQLADSASFTVRFKYSDPVLTVLKAVPAKAVLLPGDTLRLEARGFDQTGAPFPLPSLTWKALDSMPLPSSRVVRAESSQIWNSYRFQASASGGPACTVTVVVASVHLRVDAGASGDSLPEGWIADTSGGHAAAWDGRLEYGTVSDPAPEAVYRTTRTYLSPQEFSGLRDGRYAVRVHFVGARPDGNGSLPVTLLLEGMRLIEDFHLPPSRDSAEPIAVREVQVSVTDGNGLRIELESEVLGMLVAGIEIWDLGPPPIAITYPRGGETFRVGDTLRIAWETDGFITSAGIQFSRDSGKRWIPITRRSSVNLGQPEWGDYPWIIPESLDGVSLACDQCLLSVYDYFGTDRDRSNIPFRITAGGTSVKRAPAAENPRVIASGGRFLILAPRPGAWRAALVDAAGRTAARTDWRGPSPGSLPRQGLPRGVYRLAIEGPGLRWSSLISILD